MRQRIVVLLILLGSFMVACGAEPEPAATPTRPASDMPNPASAFCIEQGYELEIRDEAAGQVGYCLFPDGSECEEWAFYRGECAPASEGEVAPAALPNPASENCVAQGGTLSIQTREDGGQYGICLFEGNRQCEEWALLRGDCPVGGVKVTGYSTAAAVYCAITGGEYAITGNAGADDEQGTCTFRDGIQCDVWTYYNGTCRPGSWGSEPTIVFDSDRGGDHRDLYGMDGRGTHVVRLTAGEANSIAGPWSPDGTRIAYTTFGLTTSDIWVMNADGSGQVNLTNTPDVDEGFPAWSPDGTHIAYTTRRDGNNEIYVMRADGTNPARWTDNPADDFAPTWSPDGTMIAFVSDRDREAGIYDLYIMDVVSTAVRKLTDDEAIDYSPAWSPDGTRIAFRSHHDGPADIYVIDLDPLTGTGGTGLRNLTDDPADDWAPAWSPDSTQIAFQSNRDGNWEIYTMAADGSGATNLTNDPADDQMPYWRPYPAVAESGGQRRAASATGPQPSTAPVTARQLVAPDALMGPGPSAFNWSPQGALLAYVEPLDGRDVLWAYAPAAGEKWALLDPGDNPDQIDLSSAQWSPQGDLLLLAGETAFWLLDPDTGELRSLVEAGAGITSPAFSPNGTSIAFVQDNDLYTVAVSDGQIVRLTTDGSETVFNGTLDWVYNEELATRSSQPAYAWSPDGKWLIYLRLDESEVQNHPVTDYRTVPPTISYTRYPVAGSPNPEASLHMIALAGGQSSPVPLPADAEYVLPFFAWSPDSQEAVFVTLDRAHSSLELTAWNPASGTGRALIRETDPFWVNENSYAAPIFLDDGSQFLWLSERDGFMHLYLYSREGELIRQLTEGEWMIDTPAWNLLIPGRPVSVDPAGTWAYFSCTKNSPLERHIYRVNITSSALEQVSQPAGFHFGALSGDGQYLVDHYSDISTPPITHILKADGTEWDQLAQRAGPALKLPQVTREFLTIKARDGVDLYAQIVKPEDFDPEQEYPVIVHWYAGPTLQMVSNRYGKTNLFNHIERDVLYTQAGFIVWRLDNRGSFGRGHAFETPIAGELGKTALDDQLAGIEYLQTLPNVDASRIGCDGKSFGGYMSLYALIHAPEVFKAGVVGSAPTDWRYYDTIYTERYMGTPSENPEGYATTDLVAKADQLQARPLIIHGLNDTNVHLQNSINLIQELQALDKPFEFLPLPNLNHSYRGDSLVTALSASVDYFVRTLGGAPAPAAVSTELPPAASVTDTTPSPGTKIPLEAALGDLEPQAVFQNFYEITQIPRPSGHMDRIREFLVNFGQDLGLETVVDDAGNVIIRKPAAAGLENRQGVVLQAHMDMVPAKDDDRAFDFTTDPIRAVVSGDYLVTEGTTLGADDGIGMAMIMAVLQSQTLQTGPLEGLFTVDEETDMSGAHGLKGDVLQGSILINLDSEWDGVFLIGAAGGGHVNVSSSYPQVPAPAELVSYQVKVRGLKGGHSGVDINLGRGHGIKLLVRLLKGAVEPYGLHLARLNGGTAGNAIPRQASAVVLLPGEQVEGFTKYVQAFEATVQSELAAVEPDLSVELGAVQPPAQVMTEEFQVTLINALYATPQGVIRMSDALPDLVETSNNLGVVNVQDGHIEVVCTPRSSIDSALEDVSQMIASVWELAGYEVAFADYYPGWNPDPESPILGLMEATYRDLYGQEPEVTAVHAGLECGVIGAKYPGMDMISIGPTLHDVHSPAERLFIPSVGHVMKLLLEVLRNIPEG
jgi:dipeptidase D